RLPCTRCRRPRCVVASWADAIGETRQGPAHCRWLLLTEGRGGVGQASDSRNLKNRFLDSVQPNSLLYSVTTLREISKKATAIHGRAIGGNKKNHGSSQEDEPWITRMNRTTRIENKESS